VTRARLATALLGAWAAAFWLSEGLLQAVADASLVAAAVLALQGGTRLAGAARAPVRWTLVLAGWQAVSPLVARGLGGGALPPLALWLHCLDTAALAAAAVLGAEVVRWAVPEAIFVAGGLLSLGLAMAQNLVRWSIPVPAFLRVPVDRVHETFGGENRYAAGGFFFHRLRLAHASIAALGPALSTAMDPDGARRRRLLAAALTAACLGSIVLAYARAALLTALLLALVGGVAVARSARMRGVVVAFFLGVATVALLSPGWHARLGAASENFVGGERALARAAGWDLVSQHPWLGVGFGNYHRVALERRAVTGITEQLSRDAHSIPLTVWAETGLLGLLFWVALHATLALGLFRRARERNAVALGAALSWLGYQTLGVAHHLPFHPSVALAFALVWGAGLVHPGGGRGAGRAGDRAPQPSAER
jgi:O-antigen ligase